MTTTPSTDTRDATAGETAGGRLTAAQALRRARELITPPSNWHKGDYALDYYQNSCWPWDRNAVCWCGSGALEYVTGEQSFSMIAHQGLLFLKSVVGQWFPDWQDASDRTHAEVLDAFDRAIALAEKDPTHVAG